MSTLKGIAYLRNKLEYKRSRGLLRYKYYEQKNSAYDPGDVIPNKLKEAYKSTLGWCSKAVDSLSDRLIFDGFENDNFDFWTIYQQNNADILFESAIKGALINSCDFIYISAGADGFPRLQVLDGTNATGVIDPITNLLTEGYAVLERDDHDAPILEAYFTPDYTEFYSSVDEIATRINNPARYPLLVPIIYKPDSKRPFGHSRISRSCMDLINKARNTVTRGEVSAEFYSFPQKYVTGLSQDAEPLEKWQATISSLLQFSKDEDGDRPTLGQFTQQSMAPFIEQFRMYASAFAGETGLTLDDLGFASGNPSSSEAIKAAHENLRLTARSAQRSFGIGFINAGYLAASVRDGVAYARKEIYLTKPKWAPIFEADSASLSGIGDAFMKLQQSFPEYVTEDKLRELTGL
jgi:hypothetical protein